VKLALTRATIVWDSPTITHQWSEFKSAGTRTIMCSRCSCGPSRYYSRSNPVLTALQERHTEGEQINNEW